MAQTARKNKPLAKAKKRALMQPKLNQELDQEMESLFEEKQWKAEVEALRAQKFSSLDMAVEALIENVLAKLPWPGSDRALAKQFLQDLIQTDPELMQLLQGELKL
jgi:hypothetical protein